MPSVLPTLHMYQRSLYRLLLAGSLLTFLVIVSGALVGASAVGPACPSWPLCTDQLIQNDPSAWLTMAHRALIPLILLLLLPAAWIAWRNPQLDRLVRLPLLFAPAVLLLQVAFGAVMVLFGRYDLADAGHFALALLSFGLQVTPLAALLQPATALRRQGARSSRMRRRQTTLAWWAAGASAVLALALGAANLPNGALLTAGPAFGIGGAYAIALALSSGNFFSTWRARRDDRAMLLTTAASVALLLAALPLAFGGDVAVGLAGGVVTLAWAVTLGLAVIGMRRPLPDVPVPTTVAEQPHWRVVLNDYVSLTKPKVISLLLVTTLAAMFITPAGMPSLWLVFWTLIGGYLAAGGAGAINCALDSDLDINMGRTSRRPVPSGRISPRNALIFGLSLSALSVAIMLAFTTPLATFFSTLGIVYYAYFYTHLLKRHTWQNIIIGGGAGAIPPLVGWTAVTGRLDLAALLLFAIVFYWTPPHFWALALVKAQDYARAGVPMLPVVAGDGETRYQIVIYSVLLVGLSLLLTPIGAMGWIYLLAAAILGGLFLRDAWAVYTRGDQPAIWQLYKYSLLYLALLFVAMVLDRVLLG